MLTNNLDVRVLFSTNSKPGYVPAFSPLGSRVVCGPLWMTVQVDHQYLSIATSHHYDLSKIIEELPPEQTPNLVIVKTDAFWDNVPKNLARISCPKVLLFGDTHHGEKPLRNLIRYLDAEPFDHIVLLYDGHHAHWLTEAGYRNVHFLPGLDVENFHLPFQDHRQSQVVFVGQTGSLHPRRKYLIDELAQHNVPLTVQTATPEKASRLYGNSLITFNCSLNGDLNKRVFEALDAGAFLLTDRLSLQSGMSDLFEDGKHLVCYDSVADLIDKVRYFLANPTEAISIAREGYEHYQQRHSSSAAIAQLLEIIQDTEYSANRVGGIGDSRTSLPVCERGSLDTRMAFYELIQGVHRQVDVVQVLCMGGTEHVIDIVDLPRVRVFLVEETTDEDDLDRIQKAGVGDQVRLVQIKSLATTSWDTLVISADQIDLWLQMVLSQRRFCRIAVTGRSGAIADRIRTVLSGYRLILSDEHISVFVSPEESTKSGRNAEVMMAEYQ